jgi:hypothetical protein
MQPWHWWLLGAATLVLLAVLYVTAKCRMRYQVGQRSLRVRLGGVTLRRIRFTDIERVSKPHRDLGWFEYESWINTMDSSRRVLVIHRRRGLFKKLLISPAHRYAFRAQLRRAVALATGLELEVDAEGDAEEAEAGSAVSEQA